MRRQSAHHSEIASAGDGLRMRRHSPSPFRDPCIIALSLLLPAPLHPRPCLSPFARPCSSDPSSFSPSVLHSPRPEIRLTWVECGLQCRKAVVLEHVQQRCLAGIVQTQEQDLGILVCQPQLGKHVPEPVDDEHGCVVRGVDGCVCLSCSLLLLEWRLRQGSGRRWRQGCGTKRRSGQWKEHPRVS